MKILLITCVTLCMEHSTVPVVMQHRLQQSLGTQRFISRGYQKISMNFLINSGYTFLPFIIILMILVICGLLKIAVGDI